MNCTTLGIDLAKQVFQLHGVDERGQVVLHKRVSRSKLAEAIAQLPACVIGMEACGSAQDWARAYDADWTAARFEAIYRDVRTLKVKRLES